MSEDSLNNNNKRENEGQDINQGRGKRTKRANSKPKSKPLTTIVATETIPKVASITPITGNKATITLKTSHDNNTTENIDNDEKYDKYNDTTDNIDDYKSSGKGNYVEVNVPLNNVPLNREACTDRQTDNVSTGHSTNSLLTMMSKDIRLKQQTADNNKYRANQKARKVYAKNKWSV